MKSGAKFLSIVAPDDYKAREKYENNTNHALMFTSKQWLKVYSVVSILLYSILFVNYGDTNSITPSADDESVFCI